MVKLEIVVDDKGTAKLKQFGNEAGAVANKVEGSANKIKGAWQKASAAVGGLYSSIFNLKNLIVSVAGAGGIGYLITQTSKYGDTLAKASQRTGLTAKTIAEMGYAAKLSGAELGDIETSVKKLSRTAYDATQGLATSQRAFQQLGINVLDTQGKLKTADILFNETVDALGKVKNSTMQAALAQEVFGRSGTQLLPLLQEGAAGIAQLRQEAQQLGLVMSEDNIQASVKFEDALSRVKFAFEGVRNAIAGRYLDALGESLNQFASSLSVIIQNGTLDKFVKGIEGMFSALRTGQGEIAGLKIVLQAMTGVAGAISLVIAGLMNGFNLLKEFVTTLCQGIKWAFINLWEGILKGATSFVGALMRIAQSLPFVSDSIKENLVNAYNSLSKSHENTINEIKRLETEITTLNAPIIDTKAIIDTMVISLGNLEAANYNAANSFGETKKQTEENAEELAKTQEKGMAFLSATGFALEYNAKATENLIDKNKELADTFLQEEIFVNRLGGVIRTSLINQWSNGIGIVRAFGDAAKAMVIDLAATILSRAAILGLISIFTGGTAGAAGFLGIGNIPKFLMGFAQGGQITGGGHYRADNIPVMASHGEYVVQAPAVRQIGLSNMDKINSGQLPHRATGGIVGDSGADTGRGMNVNLTVNVNALDSADVEQFAKDKLFKVIQDGFKMRQLSVAG